MTSSGFCLLNTVAVAAAYAMYRYGREHLTIQHSEAREKDNISVCDSHGVAEDCARCSRSGALRIAIVDIDVHHGNGTEEIVRNLRYTSISMIPSLNSFDYQLSVIKCVHYSSLHRPNLTFLPLPSSWAPVSSLSYKPWLNESDPENVLFGSVNLFQGNAQENTDTDTDVTLTPTLIWL